MMHLKEKITLLINNIYKRNLGFEIILILFY